MTTTAQLLARNQDVAGFLGVYADDELPDLQKKLDSIRGDVSSQLARIKRPFQTRGRGYSAIVNYSKLSDPRGGTHWIAFGNLLGDGPAEYFDSFGVTPDHDDVILSVGTDFRDFLRKNSTTSTYVSNEFDLQALRSDTCGEWASFYVHANGLPKVVPHSSDERKVFAAPWNMFEFVHTVAKKWYPRQGALLGFEKNEDAAMRNDQKVRAWAGIINPAAQIR